MKPPARNERPASEAREITPAQVPDFVKSEFKRLRDQMLQESDGAEMKDKKGFLENLEDGVERYILVNELRDSDTRAHTQASPFMNLTPHGTYKEIHMIVDVKDGTIIKSELNRNPDPSSFSMRYS